MKAKTIDKILVKLDEIASILKQAKKEGCLDTHDDELDQLAKRCESYKANSDLPKDYSTEEFTKFKKYLEDQNRKPYGVVEPGCIKDEDACKPRLLSYVTSQEFYNAVILIKHLDKRHEYFGDRVFDYREVMMTYTIFKLVISRYYNANVEMTDRDRYVEISRGAMFIGGWYRHLCLDGISELDGREALKRFRDMRIYDALYSSMLAIEYKIAFGKVRLFTNTYNFDIWTDSDIEQVVNKAIEYLNGTLEPQKLIDIL